MWFLTLSPYGPVRARLCDSPNFFFLLLLSFSILHWSFTAYRIHLTAIRKKYGKDRLFFGWVGKAVWRPRRKWYATTQRWHCARTSARPLQQQCVRRRMIRSLFPFMFFFSSSVFSFRSLNSIILLFFLLRSRRKIVIRWHQIKHKAENVLQTPKTRLLFW